MTSFEIAPSALADNVAELRAAYGEKGVFVLKEFLIRDRCFEQYISDLSFLFGALEEHLGLPAAGSLHDRIRSVFRSDPALARHVHELGSHPAKLLSANLLKYRAEFVLLVRELLGADAVIASPTGSDNLLFFFPGERFDKYALPLHQDFPYIMQSSQQLTIWIPLTPRYEKVGGFDARIGSHTLGICKNKPTARGMEIQIDDEAVAGMPLIEIEWELGDVVVINSLLLHRSIPNTSENNVRAVQLFRFSNLATQESKNYFWQSTNPISAKGSVTFPQVYPQLMVPADT